MRFSATLCGLAVVCCASPAVCSDVVSVYLLVDEEEATNPRSWQPRLATRIEKASAIISKYTRVRLKVQGFGTWKSTNSIQDFSRSLREFEQRVDPGQARLAIGFSSQFRFQRGRNHLGGTRGPLRKHILIRENAPSVLEPERIEVLVHELGHFFGAAHSTSLQSVMRPVVGDGRARSKAFDIAFDKHNGEILRLVGNDMRFHHVRRFQDLTPPTLSKLRPHYVALAGESKSDVTAERFLFMVDMLQNMHGQRKAAGAR